MVVVSSDVINYVFVVDNNTCHEWLHIHDKFMRHEHQALNVTLWFSTGYEPWLKNRTCDSFKQSHDVPISKENADSGLTSEIIQDFLVQDEVQEQHNLENLQGQFGHHALGNVTSFLNESTGGLMLETGIGWKFDLLPIDNTTFLAKGVDPVWYQFNVVTFEVDDEGVAASLTGLIQGTRYDRNLDWNSPPPPPELCLSTCNNF